MLLAFFIIPIWWRFRVHSINSRAFGDPPPPIIECRWFLGNVDATGTEPVPTAKTFRFGPFLDYGESEISVLVRNSINPAYVYLALEHLCDIVLGAIAYRIAEPATRIIGRKG